MENLLKKCPNCGHAIEHFYNHKCPYCRTYLHMTDENIKKVNNVEIKIENIDLVRNPLNADYILTLKGWTVPKMYYLEEMYQNNFVISGDNVGKPVGYNIEIPMEMFYRNDEKEIIDYIFHCLPPELSDGRTEQLIIEKLYEKMRKG